MAFRFLHLPSSHLLFKILGSCKVVPSAENSSSSLFAVTLIKESYPFEFSVLPSVTMIPLFLATMEAFTAVTGELKMDLLLPEVQFWLTFQDCRFWIILRVNNFNFFNFSVYCL